MSTPSLSDIIAAGMRTLGATTADMTISPFRADLGKPTDAAGGSYSIEVQQVRLPADSGLSYTFVFTDLAKSEEDAPAEEIAPVADPTPVLTAFLFLLIRDKLPAGALADLVGTASLSRDGTDYIDPAQMLAQVAKRWADIIMGREAQESLR